MNAAAFSISLRPTGADGTYRRLDYLRGSLICILVAAASLSVTVFATVRGTGESLLYIAFAGVLLGLVGLGAAIIFVIQAIVGSPQPASFALPAGYLPVKLRARLRAILSGEWNPEGRELSDARAYDSYLSVVYAMASQLLDPEEIALGLEQLETTAAFVPGSDHARRLQTAEHLFDLVTERATR